jgi:hypothetical protein
MKIMNIGQLITWLILNTSKSNSDILDVVKEKFPECKTSPACVAWYKTKLRKQGLIAKSAGKFKLDMTADDLAAEFGESNEE